MKLKGVLRSVDNGETWILVRLDYLTNDNGDFFNTPKDFQLVLKKVNGNIEKKDVEREESKGRTVLKEANPDLLWTVESEVTA